jgi:hypothetical protein
LFGKRTCGQQRKSGHYDEMLLSQPNRGEAACGAPLHDALNPAQANLARRRAALILSQLVVGALALAAWAAPLRAETIPIPNASFESPPTDFATPLIDSWQQIPPADFLNNVFQSGVFSNVPPPIDNCDGDQCAFLFVASNQVAILQDYDSTDWANPTPTHAFSATFEVGKSYTLTVGVLGGTNLSIPMQEGTRLALSLYYRDGANMVTVAATTITNSGSLFPSPTHFIDFKVRVPTVKASDAWASRHIGVQLLSSVFDTALAGGYWDVDNVRLVAGPVLLTPARSNGQCTFTLESEPGLRFEILASTNLALPLSNWTSLGTLTNVTGDVPFLDPATNLNSRFYRARQLQ